MTFPNPARRDTLFAHLAMLLHASLIAGSFTFGAMAVPFLDPAPLNAVRFILATMMMGIAALVIGKEPLRLPTAPWRFAMLGLLMGTYFVSMFIALTLTEPIATSAVFTLIPLMTAAFGFLVLKQRTGPRVLASLVFAGVGSLWVIFRGDLEALLRFQVGRGEMVYFVGCICQAAYIPLLRLFNRGEGSLGLTFYTLFATAAWIILYAAPQLSGVDWFALPGLVWWVLLYLAIFPTAVSFFLLQYASSRLPAAKTLAYGYLTPVIVIMLEGVLGHGWASLGIAFGAAVTVVGLVIMAFSPDREVRAG